MNKLWNRETLRFVNRWTCKDGTPEDDEDKRNGSLVVEEKVAIKIIEEMKSSEIMLNRVRLMKKERLLGVFDVGVLHCEFGIT